MLKSLIAGLLGVVAIQASAAAEPISLNGSTTVMNAIVMPKKAEIEKLSGQTITIVGNGSQRGIADLAGGKAQIAMISAPLADEVEKLNKLQPGAIDPAKLHAHQIGETRVAFAVHPSNGVKTLSDAQLADILAGKVTNWKEIGGTDQAIVIVAAQPGDGVRTMVETTLLKGVSLPASTRALSNAGQIVKVVAQLPGGIGLIAAASLDATVAEIKAATPITQPLILVTMGEETPAIQQIIEAATKVGKAS
jgi:phosphate transport system substrate-binding protein